MTDRLTKERRSWNMSRIRGRDTAPELTLRRYIHKAGFRYRLHRRDLPGCPDLVLPKYHTAIFVHGCFWHRHKGCRFAYTPKSRVRFWLQKFADNQRRDKSNSARLRALGWKVVITWECELTRNPGAMVARIEAILRSQKATRTPGYS